MGEKSTGDLQLELMEQPDMGKYLRENEEYFRERDVPELLSELIQRCGLQKALLARKAGMSEVYLYQVLSGRRKPSRDRLLCLCVGAGASLEETRELLKKASYAQLYPRRKREAIICHGLVHGESLEQINDILFRENEKTLF